MSADRPPPPTRAQPCVSTDEWWRRPSADGYPAETPGLTSRFSSRSFGAATEMCLQASSPSSSQVARDSTCTAVSNRRPPGCGPPRILKARGPPAHRNARHCLRSSPPHSHRRMPALAPCHPNGLLRRSTKVRARRAFGVRRVQSRNSCNRAGQCLQMRPREASVMWQLDSSRHVTSSWRSCAKAL